MRFRFERRQFDWQPTKRLWLRYFHPATGEWRYTYIRRFFSVWRDVRYATRQNRVHRTGGGRV